MPEKSEDKAGRDTGWTKENGGRVCARPPRVSRNSGYYGANLPMPVSVTVCGLLFALSKIFNVPLRVPT